MEKILNLQKDSQQSELKETLEHHKMTFKETKTSRSCFNKSIYPDRETIVIDDYRYPIENVLETKDNGGFF